MNPSGIAFLSKEKIATRTGLPSPKPIDGSSGKVDQASADYSGADEKCQACAHFTPPDSCTKVDGEISPDGHSRFFERAQPNTQDRNSETVGYEEED